MPYGGRPYSLKAYLQKHELDDTASDVDTNKIGLDDNPLGVYQEIVGEFPAGTPKTAVVRLGDKSVTLAAPADFIVNDPKIKVGPSCAPGPTRITVDDIAVWLTP